MKTIESVLTEGGWIRKELSNEHGRCLLGAAQHAYQDSERVTDWSDAYYGMLQYANDAGYVSILVLNDAQPAFNDVILACARAGDAMVYERVHNDA